MQGDTIEESTYFTPQGCRVTTVIRNGKDKEIILACDDRPEIDVE